MNILKSNNLIQIVTFFTAILLTYIFLNDMLLLINMRNKRGEKMKNGGQIINLIFNKIISIIVLVIVLSIYLLIAPINEVNAATYNYETIATLNISSKFRIITEKLETSNSYKIRVISINNEYPHVELKQAISNGIWFDDYNFIYSVKGMGIYCYNAKTRQYTTIVSGNEDFIIKKVEDNLLYYDETSVAVSVN